MADEGFWKHSIRPGSITRLTFGVVMSDFERLSTASLTTATSRARAENFKLVLGLLREVWMGQYSNHFE